jgi:hypothetical protein
VFEQSPCWREKEKDWAMTNGKLDCQAGEFAGLECSDWKL